MSLLQLRTHCTKRCIYVRPAWIPEATRVHIAWQRILRLRCISVNVESCTAVSSIKSILNFEVVLWWVLYLFLFFFFTGVHLGCSLDLDPLQLSQARRLCWNQIRRSDERRLPPNAISIHLLWNLTSFVILICFTSLTFPREAVQWRGAQAKGHNTVREEETHRIETVNLVNVPELKKSLWYNPQNRFFFLGFNSNLQTSFVFTVCLYNS